MCGDSILKEESLLEKDLADVFFIVLAKFVVVE